MKRTLDEERKKKALEQLNGGYSIISSKVPFPKASKWKYIQCISFEEKKVEASIKFQEWLNELLSQIQDQSDGSQACEVDTETYLNILKYLLHQMFIQEDVLTQGKLLF